MKIRLGDAVLIHEAAKPTDIGRLVSHGCVRMRTQDLFDLAEKIVAAKSLAVTPEQIERAKKTSAKLTAKMDPPLWVDIDYDTEVIEDGKLHLYPDVYARGRRSLEDLHAELAERGIAAEKLDKRTLDGMKRHIGPSAQFVVSIDDLESGRALKAGRKQPLTDTPTAKPRA